MEVKVEIEKGEGKEKEPEKWEIDCWVRTVLEAEEIKADPKKAGLVKAALEDKAKAMGKAKMSLEKIKKLAADAPLDEED